MRLAYAWRISPAQLRACTLAETRAMTELLEQLAAHDNDDQDQEVTDGWW